MKRLLVASFLLTSMTMNAQNMENALTSRRQALAVTHGWRMPVQMNGREAFMLE